MIGSVAQSDSLFAGSLAENIAFFDPDIDLARVEKAAELACIHNDIEKMPMRFNTMVGDMGSVLSGGQKQRMLIARALYNTPKILFLDEGTSHLDPEIEETLLKSLLSLDITIIAVAHRAKSIENAKRVFIIVDGLAHEKLQ